MVTDNTSFTSKNNPSKTSYLIYSPIGSTVGDFHYYDCLQQKTARPQQKYYNGADIAMLLDAFIVPV